jgi:hypothetical protein
MSRVKGHQNTIKAMITSKTPKDDGVLGVRSISRRH